MNEWAVNNGYWRYDPHVFTPGMGWYLPYYYDPFDELAKLRESGIRTREEPMITKDRKGELGFLSKFYWRDWADKRPPIAVVCPNGEIWEIDRKSSNGEGWTVSGEWPNLSCSPSIVVEGYHGFLGISGAPPGKFTSDIEGRGPNGKPRAYTPRT
jgi:hypothetical protein